MPLISGIPPAPQLGRCPGQPPLPESSQPCRATCSTTASRRGSGTYRPEAEARPLFKVRTPGG
jgi:hypothetical protein